MNAEETPDHIVEPGSSISHPETADGFIRHTVASHIPKYPQNEGCDLSSQYYYAMCNAPFASVVQSPERDLKADESAQRSGCDT
jgi:hypothetical protein